MQMQSLMSIVYFLFLYESELSKYRCNLLLEWNTFIKDFVRKIAYKPVPGTCMPCLARHVRPDIGPGSTCRARAIHQPCAMD